MPNSLNWLKISIHHPPDAAEAISTLLFEEGSQGVWEDLPDRQGRLVSRAGFDPALRERLETRLPEIIAQTAEAFALPRSDFEYHIDLEENHDWAEKWKEGLNPITIGRKLAIAPTWWPEDDLPQTDLLLRLDPGLAFGSGHHATTYLCLALLAELAPTAGRVLDVGAGSGILTIAAAVLNPAAWAVGVDNDLTTIEVAEENAALNQVSGLEFSGQDLSQLAGHFDLIVANITLNPLLGLAPLISERGLAGGKLILSGLLETQAAEARAEYEKYGWQLQRHWGRDEWSALVFGRDSSAPVPEIFRELV